MAATSRRRVEVTIDDERGVFMISVAAELAEMHPQTLRMYEARGLIAPKRSPKNTRLYSQRDVERLRRIQQMTAEGLNLVGVETVLALEERVERMRAELERMRRRVEELEASGKEAALMQADRFTVKSQEAVAAAQAAGRRAPQPRGHPAHLLVALLEQDDGLVVPILQKLGADPAAIGARAARGGRGAADAERGRPSRGCPRRLAADPAPGREGDGEARRRVHLDRAPAAGADRRRLRRRRPPARPRPAGEGDRRGPRPAPRHLAQPRGQRPGAGEIRPRPDRRRARAASSTR